MKNKKYRVIAFILVFAILVTLIPFRAQAQSAVYNYLDFVKSIAEAQGYRCAVDTVKMEAALKDGNASAYIDGCMRYLDDFMGFSAIDDMVKAGKLKFEHDGIHMTQDLWDAFHNFFDSVESKKKVDSESSFYNLSDLSNYVSGLIGKKVNFNDSCYNVFLNKNIYVYAGYVGNNVYHYLLYCPKKTDVRHVTQDDNVIIGYGGKYGGFVDRNNQLVSCYLTVINIDGRIISFYDDASVSFYDKFVLLGKKWIIQKDFNEVYSPYIDYSIVNNFPATVPDVIPWEHYPDYQTQDTDDKIVVYPNDKVELVVPGQEPVELHPATEPEEPEKQEPDTEPSTEDSTEEPEKDKNSWFDDIFNIIPIFKPDVDLDFRPDVDVDLDDDSSGNLARKIPNLAKLKTKFPFCIPFDLVLLTKTLKKSPEAPKWEFSHTFEFGNGKEYTWEFTVDMSDYDKYVEIFRDGFFIIFLVGLFFATRKLISWQT